jgi:hypothetical protein
VGLMEIELFHRNFHCPVSWEKVLKYCQEHGISNTTMHPHFPLFQLKSLWLSLNCTSACCLQMDIIVKDNLFSS